MKPISTKNWLAIFLAGLLSQVASAEVQTTLNLTAPDLAMGNSDNYSSSQTSGPAGTSSGSILQSYAGVVRFTQNSGTGRFSTTNGVVRYGLQYDTFLIFQSFLAGNYLTVTSSGTACPSSTTYNWMMVRFRTPDAARDPMNGTSTSLYVGGTMSNDSSTSVFTGNNYFNLAGPTLSPSPTYGISGKSAATCSSGKYLGQFTGTSSFDSYAQIFFGANTVAMITNHGSPEVILGVPQQTLSNGSMSSLSNYVFTGLWTVFNARADQTQKNIYLVPDVVGTTWSIKEASSLTDPTSRSDLGTLTCTSLNSPTTGFCSGSLTLASVGGTGNAVCAVYSDSAENLMVCAAQKPNDNTRLVSIIAKTVKQAVLQVSLSAPSVGVTNANDSTQLTATVTNLSSRYVPSLGNPSNGALQLAAPWSNTNAFGGGSGTCGTELNAYASCTFPVTYQPSAIGSNSRTLRVAYENYSGNTVNATASLVGTAGLSSITLSPSSIGNVATGSTQQLTAIATYSNASTQDVTSIVSWSSSNTAVGTVSSSGLASWVSEGSVTLTATLSGQSASVNPAVYQAVLLTDISDQHFPSNHLNQGSLSSYDFNNISAGIPGNDTNITYACVYDQVIDGAVNTGTNCTSLAGTVSFGTSTGALSWTPDKSVFGYYELKVTGTRIAGVAHSRIFVLDVRPGYVTTNLRGSWDAQFADLEKNYSSANNSWKDLTTNAYHGTTSSTTNATWVGSGTGSSPYALSLNGSAYVDFGSNPFSSQTRGMFSTWIKPSAVTSSADSVIVGNSTNASGSGFTVRHQPSHRDVVMSLSPVGYWRLGETSGTTAADSSGNGYNGTYTNGPTLNQVGGLTADENASASYDGSDDYVSIGNVVNLKNISFSVSAWANLNTIAADSAIVSKYSGGIPRPFQLYYSNAQAAFGFQYDLNKTSWSWSTGLTISTGTWYHLVGVYDSSAQTVTLYVNGIIQNVATSATTISSDGRPLWIGATNDSNPKYFNGKIDDVALFTTALTSAQVTKLYRSGTIGKKVDLVIGKSYPDVVLADSPVAYWRLGESSGKTAVDSSGNGRNGIYLNGVALAQSGAISGDADKAVTIDGNNDDIQILSDVPNLTASHSIEAWIYPTSFSNYNVIVDSQTTAGTANNQYDLYLANDGKAYSYMTSGCGTASALSTNTWNHVVTTYDGTNIRMYLNGSLSNTCAQSKPSVTTAYLRLGTRAYRVYPFAGNLDEISIYNTALSGPQITAHYDASSSSNASICRSTTGLTDGFWSSIGGIFSTSTSKLFVNGREECSVSSGGGFSSPASNLFLGATSSNTLHFTGSVGDLQVYGTSNGSAVGTSTDVNTNFNSTADKYRTTPVGNLVTSGLIVGLDPANAKRGLGPYSNGCASGDLSWFDLSSSAYTSTLTNFSSCGTTSGWNGDGTTTVSGANGPYRLTLDGTNDNVSLGTSAGDLDGTSALSMCAWVNTSDASQSWPAVIGKECSGNSGYELLAGVGSSSKPGVYLKTVSNGWASAAASDTVLSAGTWYHLCFTYDGATSKIYLNGALDRTMTTVTGNIQSGNGCELQIGEGNGSYFEGHLGPVQIYNTTLTGSEISQNCNAHKARFNGASCN